MGLVIMLGFFTFIAQRIAMRTLRSLFVLLLVLPVFALAQQMPTPPQLEAKAWLLTEFGSGQTLVSQSENDRLEPASLTKLMTAYLTFSALKQGTIKINQAVPVSDRAWKTGGSRMFIQVNSQVPVEDLIKGMIVQSGNDACVALAEAIAGSEDNFAQMMNREAQRLGMKSSHFMNATGLPDPQHFTTARDLSILATALIRDFPNDYAKYYSLKEFTYNNITQPNRNRLLFIDPTVDGMKTGHTDGAGYCLISSAKRDGRRLVSVVLGTASDAKRATESQKLLNFGYQFYDAVKLATKGQAVATLRVWKGETSELKAGFAEDRVVAVVKGFGDKVKSQFVAQPRLIAPIKAGQTVGTMSVTLDGKPYASYNVVALENVAEAGFFGRLIDTIRLWFN